MTTARTRLVVGLLACVLPLGAAVIVVGAEPRRGLEALVRVAVMVTLDPAVPGLSTPDLERRLEAALGKNRSAPTLDPSSSDRLRLSVAVRRYSSAELRGFYLPFSGTYGIGPVRLVVERRATIPQVPVPVHVIVWESERLAKGPWRRSATEILGLVDEVVAAFFMGGRPDGQLCPGSPFDRSGSFR